MYEQHVTTYTVTYSYFIQVHSHIRSNNEVSEAPIDACEIGRVRVPQTNKLTTRCSNDDALQTDALPEQDQRIPEGLAII